MSEDTKLILRKLDGIDGHLERIEEDVAELKEDVAVLKEDVAELKEDVAILKEDVTELKEDVAVLKEDVAELKEDMEGLRDDVTNLQLIVENEIRPNIQMLAEGHMMLSEKVDNVLDYEKEKEEMKYRVDALETGFQLMQDRNDKTA